MVIKACFSCEFHTLKEVEKGQKSHCQKENCWSEFSKCVAKKALKRFLEQESLEHKLAETTCQDVNLPMGILLKFKPFA